MFFSAASPPGCHQQPNYQLSVYIKVDLVQKWMSAKRKDSSGVMRRLDQRRSRLMKLVTADLKPGCVLRHFKRPHQGEKFPWSWEIDGLMCVCGRGFVCVCVQSCRADDADGLCGDSGGGQAGSHLPRPGDAPQPAQPHDAERYRYSRLFDFSCGFNSLYRKTRRN